MGRAVGQREAAQAGPDAELASAKVNLSLHVVGQRADGYHLLESLVAFTGEGDVVHFAASERLSLTIDGPFASGLESDPTNLVLRAAAALGVDACGIRLEKRLPVASGIGGGSADAAATLRGIMRRYQLSVPDDELDRIALTLGADVPVCLRSRACFMAGIGERVETVGPLPDVGILLVNPRVAVATAAVFRELGLAARLAAGEEPGSPHPPLPAQWRDAAHFAEFITLCRNDLEAPAQRLAPVIAEVLDRLRQETGCLVARMSGSGATCFGLFPTREQAAAAGTRIAADHPGWWLMASQLR
ncbi:4-(cytidine 5'-diphospho)-2-C-methyl-D-erythritol kinase [Rhodoligotrophos ferricapiens]|uniref:4-(cytidine 5'-diphospho)-2-C-methyl-D-erythritol kinase n=1 Tax=Rhodoligotrophos ferricapiens TaxID=3069264 RepID=UPI00315DF040